MHSCFNCGEKEENKKMNLNDAWEAVYAWQKIYLKTCDKKRKKPDFHYVKNRMNSMVRHLFQR